MTPTETFHPLRIDAPAITHHVETYIRSLADEHGGDGVVMGLSGGLDSALLATLAARALGPENVRGQFLYDCHTEATSHRRSQLVADWLGIDLQCEDIEAAMREGDTYDVFLMWPGAVPSFLSRRIFIPLYRLVFGEMPFLTSLRRGELGGRRFLRLIHRHFVAKVEGAFNARHRYRREYVEARTERENLLMLGAANRTEAALGWFVRGGIDGLPASQQPLIGLYKTQIHELAEHLDLPEEICGQTPSPDMMRGLRDEWAMGISYWKSDLALHAMTAGKDDEEIVETTVLTRREVRLVREMHRLSAWKRDDEPLQPPVDAAAFPHPALA